MRCFWVWDDMHLLGFCRGNSGVSGEDGVLPAGDDISQGDIVHLNDSGYQGINWRIPVNQFEAATYSR